MADWFVDSAIGASGDGTSWATAWQNLSDIVWASVAAGDTIYLSGGSTEKVYAEALIIGAGGTVGNPITVTRGVDAGHDGTPIVDGTNSVAWGIDNGRSAIEQDYVTVSNLTVRDFTSGGFGIRFCTGFVAESCAVRCGATGSAPRAFDIRSTADTTVRGCTVTTPSSTTGQTDGFWSQDNTGKLYENNTVDISNTDDTGHSDAYHAHLDGGGTVRNNVFYSPTAGIDNKVIWIHANLTGTITDFYNNVCVSRGGQNNVSYWREADASPDGTLRIWNNTIVGGGRAVNLERVANVEAKNNIVWPDASGFGVYSNLVDPATGDVTNNVVWAPSATVARTNANGNRTYAQWTADGYNAGGDNADPLFVDRPGEDFHLGAGSPAIDLGATLAAVATDIEGRARPQRASYDVGAFETPWPKVSTLVDDFSSDDGTFVDFLAGGTIAGGVCSMPYTTTSTVKQTAATFDLTESQVDVEVVTLGTVTSDEAYFCFGASGGLFDASQFQIIVGQSATPGEYYLVPREIDAAAANVLPEPFIDVMPAEVRWLRIRHDGTEVFWETSPDQSTWTIRRQKVPTFTPSAGRVKLAGFNHTGNGVAAAEYDNVNGGPVEEHAASTTIALAVGVAGATSKQVGTAAALGLDLSSDAATTKQGAADSAIGAALGVAGDAVAVGDVSATTTISLNLTVAGDAVKDVGAVADLGLQLAAAGTAGTEGDSGAIRIIAVSGPAAVTLPLPNGAGVSRTVTGADLSRKVDGAAVKPIGITVAKSATPTPTGAAHQNRTPSGPALSRKVTGAGA